MVIFPPAGGCHLLSFAFGVIMLRGIYGHFSASIHGQFLFPLRHKEHKELESRLPAVLFMVIYPPVGGCHLLSFAFGVIMLGVIHGQFLFPLRHKGHEGLGVLNAYGVIYSQNASLSLCFASFIVICLRFLMFRLNLE